MVAGVRFELTGYELDDQTLSPIDSVALTAIGPPKEMKKGRVLDPSWTLLGCTDSL